MATVNPTLIASQVVGSGGASSITFSSIPQTYTDLKVVLSTRSTSTSSGNVWDNTHMYPNNVSTGISAIGVFGLNGSTTSSNTDTNSSGGDSNGNTTTSNTFSNVEIYIPNYTSSNYKSWSVDTIVENNSSSTNILRLEALLWSNTAAITSLVFSLLNGNFAQYSTFYLYGIKNS